MARQYSRELVLAKLKHKLTYSNPRSLVIDHWASLLPITIPGPNIAFFYCARDAAEPERSNPSEILLSIARQLSGHDPRSPIRLPLIKRYEDLHGIGARPRRLDLQEAVELILDLTEETSAVIVIDALDECDHATRYMLMDALDEILQRSSTVLKLLISSRDDGDIVCRLSGSINLYISADDNRYDIERFIDDRLAAAVRSRRILNGNASPTLVNSIAEVLKRDARGMYVIPHPPGAAAQRPLI